MKAITLALLFSVLFIGCRDPLSTNDQPPLPPQGLFALALDNRVDLSWFPSQIEHTVAYRVWVSDAFNGKYVLIGETSNTFFVDDEALNGELYFYAVSSVNDAGIESALTADYVRAIPRPEGSGAVITDFHTTPGLAGYDFASNTPGQYNDAYTDVYFENASGLHYLNVFSDTDIQDMGYTQDLDVILESPDANSGWAPSRSVEAIVGHTYVVWTNDDHFAKMRITAVSNASVTFEWAYQTVQGSRLLKSRPARVQGTTGSVGRLPAIHR